MNKILKEIPGFPYQYISEDGHLVSFKNGLYEPAPFYDRDGYKRYVVYNESGKRKGVGAHRLVYSAWIGNLIDGPTVDHKDEDKKNNHYLNLEQMTFEKNTSKSVNGKCDPRKSRKLTKETIESVFKMRSQGMSYNAISRKINMSPAMSWHIVNGTTYFDITGVTNV